MASTSVEWIVELFPFKSDEPSKNDFGSSFGSVSDLAKSAVNLTLGDTSFDGTGIKSIMMDRSKDRPDSQCIMTVAGPVHQDMVVGTWVVISTRSRFMADTNISQLDRFVGQIYLIEYNYSSEASGLVSLVSTVYIREWSSILTMPVRVDVVSMMEESKRASDFSGVAGLLQATNKAANKKDDDFLTDMVIRSYDPFEMGHLVLSVVGALNAADAVSKVKGLEGLPNVATKTNLIPNEVMKRLGLKAEKLPSIGGSENSFQSGFCRTITGIQTTPVYNSGRWSGIWGEPPLGIYTIDNYSKLLSLSLKIKDRPSAPGLASLIQMIGTSAWQLMNVMINTEINEVFTDVLYEEDDKGVVVAKPTIIIRDKPFLLKKLKDRFNEGSSLENWTLYDNLPRVNLPSDLIISFKMMNTFVNSPNYIRVNLNAPNMDEKLGKAEAALLGLRRLENEMNRFGGQSGSVSSQFLGRDFVTSAKDPRDAGDLTRGFFDHKGWIKKLALLYELWNSYDYRMGSGVITIKDANIPISVGFNIQFSIKNYTLVGHVDSVSTSMIVESSGLSHTTTNIRVSRILYVDDAGELDFIPLKDMGNLFTNNKTQSGVSVFTDASASTNPLQGNA